MQAWIRRYLLSPTISFRFGVAMINGADMIQQLTHIKSMDVQPSHSSERKIKHITHPRTPCHEYHPMKSDPFPRTPYHLRRSLAGYLNKKNHALVMHNAVIAPYSVSMSSAKNSLDTRNAERRIMLKGINAA